MKDKSVDYTFTSPPYNRKRNDKYDNYNDTVANYYEWQINCIKEMLRVTQKHVIYNIQTNYYNRADVYKIIGHFNKEIRDIFVWEKTNPMPAQGYSITNSVEYFIFLGDINIKANKTYTKNIIHSSVNTKMPKNHKGVMKQEIADYFIEQFTQPNDTILDPFMGTGTTGISCKKLQREFIGIEKDEEYYNTAVERINHGF